MQNERRGEIRWPTAAHVHITFQNGAQTTSRILNVNLGGCFLEGSFGLQPGGVVAQHGEASSHAGAGEDGGFDDVERRVLEEHGGHQRVAVLGQ